MTLYEERRMQISDLKVRKRSKRKPSDLTSEEVSNVVSLLKYLVVDLDEEEQIVIENVQIVIRKLSQDTPVCLGFFFVVLAIDVSLYNSF